MAAKDGKFDGGQDVSDADAAKCLSQGHPKSKPVPTKWNMKNSNGPGEKLTGRGD